MKHYASFFVLIWGAAFANDTVDAVKRQNTLLTSPDSLVGIYKQDLVNAVFFVNHMVADSLLYNKLVERSVTHTMHEVFKDIDGLIDVLEQTKRSEDRFDERMAFAAFHGERYMSVKKKRRVLFNPLGRYLVQHHGVKTALNGKTLKVLALRWGWDRASSIAEQALVVPSPSWLSRFLAVGSDELQKAHSQAFVYQGEELMPVEYAPYSATTFVKGLGFLVSPFMAFRSSLRTGYASFKVSQLSFFNRALGTKLPGWLFTQGIITALECVELIGAVSFFNKINTMKWVHFAVDRRYELLRLLYAYRHVVEDPTGHEEHVILIRDEIRDFIKKGYLRKKWLPSVWWTSQYKSSQSLGSGFWYATLAILCLKGANLLCSKIQHQ